MVLKTDIHSRTNLKLTHILFPVGLRHCRYEIQCSRRSKNVIFLWLKGKRQNEEQDV